ncbi:MAG: dephospho-CoA kinase [Thermodesulfobacteriota bacterium]
MLVIGLVGGIGSGKSTAAAILAELGAEVINADVIGHEVYAPGKPGFDAIVAEFGTDVVGPDGRIDRKRLGALVFADSAKLSRLNAIVHPLIRAEIERRITRAREENRVRAVVVEAAILLEAGWRSLVDQVWVICARRDDVVERLASQRGMAEAETAARMAKQMAEGERRAAADVVIENEGSIDDLRARLAGLWQTLVPR